LYTVISDLNLLAYLKQNRMKEIFETLKNNLTGKWSGEGFAKYPTIQSTFYTEVLEFEPDEFKDSIYFNQKSRYKNNTEKNGQTVFWDVGFIALKEEKIFLVSAQIGGRTETYELRDFANDQFIFNTINIQNDLKTITTQRIFKIKDDVLEYELNMSTHQNVHFENHLTAKLSKF
jgi:hypothetical protein